MIIIRQLGIILAFAYASEVLARLIPIALPSGVLGILLLLLALGLRLLKPEHLGQSADFLSANMAFFFLPLSVAILQNFDAIRPVVLRLFGICMVCTIITFAVTYATVRFFRVILSLKKTGST
jgi:holin-like protein